MFSFDGKIKSHCLHLKRKIQLARQTQVFSFQNPWIEPSLNPKTDLHMTSNSRIWVTFGLQQNTLGKLFSLHSFKNSNCSTSSKILCQGNSISISLRSPQDFLNFFILWTPMGFPWLTTTVHRKISSVFIYRFYSSSGLPLSITANLKGGSAQGEAVGGECWVTHSSLPLPQATIQSAGAAVSATSWEQPMISLRVNSQFRKHWENTECLFGIIIDCKLNRAQEC